MNKEERQHAINLARLQAAAQYAARPPQTLDGARGLRVPPMSDSYRQAVEDFRLWSENISAREEDCKNGRTPRERYEPRKF